ncbi:MAG: alpha/beta hydrolase-fold protein [Butyrivibrio sp.]|nr:alpha/beta hydrolase-fold protein [Butyrivibrio sp.]
MSKISTLLSEMPPEEILKKRSGAYYPKFKKYTYYSQTAERDTPVNVLLPAGYSEEKEYPVLYILHGYYDNEEWMAREAVHIPEMLTNLVSNGEAKEMIVVLPYIYCSKDMPYCTGMDTQNTLNYDNFINDMLTDLIPFIEESFSVAKGRENTAITGFSMDGRESLFIGISRPDLFGYIGAVCPAPGLTKGSGDPWQLETSELAFDDNAPYLLLLSAAENDGAVGGNPALYDRLFTRNKVEHLWHTMSSTGHDASSVTPHLYNYLRMIFQ